MRVHVSYREMTHSSPAAPRWDARLWGALILLCGVVFLDGLDVAMVGVALPSIRSDLGLSTSQLQWVVSGYVLGYGGLLLLGGRAADMLGRRRVLIAGLSVFVVASAIGGLAGHGSPPLRRRRCGDDHHGDAVARPHGRRGAQRGLGRSGHDRVVR